MSVEHVDRGSGGARPSRGFRHSRWRVLLLEAVPRVLVCVGVIVIASGGAAWFVRLGPAEQGRVAGLVIMGAAIVWLSVSLWGIAAQRTSPCAVVRAEPTMPSAVSETMRFRRWVDAQLKDGQDPDELADQLRPAWQTQHTHDDLDDQARARHEAAHAVVAHALGHTVISVDIRTIGGRGGHLDSVPPPPLGGDRGHDLWDALTITVAGSTLDLAEHRTHTGSSTDIQRSETEAAALISTGHTPDDLNGPPTTIAQAITAARHRATRILITHHHQIDALTAALTQHHQLTGRQTRDLLQNTNHNNHKETPHV